MEAFKSLLTPLDFGAYLRKVHFMAVPTDYDLAPMLTEQILVRFALASSQLDNRVEKDLTMEQWRTQTRVLVEQTATQLCDLFKWNKS